MRLAVATFALTAALSAQSLTVHQWGTFTAVVDPEGYFVEVAPPADDFLPCFVYRLPSAATSPAAVRLEASALTFYAEQATTLDVRLDLPQAWVTLTIAPAPASITRAYVGRIEMLAESASEPVRRSVPMRRSTDAFTECNPTPR